MIASDNITHSKETVITYIDMILDLLPANMKTTSFWSHSPSSQFKNRYHIASLAGLQQDHKEGNIKKVNYLEDIVKRRSHCCDNLNNLMCTTVRKSPTEGVTWSTVVRSRPKRPADIIAAMKSPPSKTKKPVIGTARATGIAAMKKRNKRANIFMLTTISSMKNRSSMFTHKNYAIYVLDDYSVHITSEVRQALLTRGYILVCIGGGITGDIQVNDTHVHHMLKKEYRKRESALMLKQLTDNPQKVPNPTRDDIMTMLASSWEALKVDPVLALKNNYILNKLGGSEG